MVRIDRLTTSWCELGTRSYHAKALHYGTGPAAGRVGAGGLGRA